MASVKIHFRMKRRGGRPIAGAGERLQNVSAPGVNLPANIADGACLIDVETANAQLPRSIMGHVLGQIVAGGEAINNVATPLFSNSMARMVVITEVPMSANATTAACTPVCANWSANTRICAVIVPRTD